MPGKRELGADKTAAATTETTTAKPKRLWLIPVCLAVLLVGAYAGFCAAAATRDVIAPHTTVGETDVSGLTRDEAAQQIGAALDAFRTGSGVRAVLDNGESAAYLSYDELGVTFDVDALADSAYASSHSGNALSDGWTLLRAALGKSTELTPVPVEGWTLNAAKAIAAASALEPIDASYEVTDADELLLTKERSGRKIDESQLRQRILDADADESGTRTVTLPYTETPAKSLDLNVLDEQLGGEMANARYDAETNSILPERMALHFDAAQARSILDAAAPGETVSVPAELLEPTVTAAQLQELLFRDTLGSYTTKVSGSSGRRSNVKLTASRVNGVVLNSGETFDYYTYTGPFSRSNGYLPAPGYQHGKTVDMDGGGACQCSSTIYAASLLANLEIVARTAHGFASSYIGLGLDATVSGGGPDFRFRNNTPYPLKIQAVYSDDHRLTINIIGTKTDNTTVKMRTQVLSTTPYAEEIVEDPALAPGQRVVDTTPYVGYTVNTYRQIYDADGNLISESFEAFSRYNKRNRIIHVGPGGDTATDALAETPAETPTDTPAPAETPVESPAPAPAETPVEAPAPAPAETPVEAPAPVETPVEAPAPAETITETPAA